MFRATVCPSSGEFTVSMDTGIFYSAVGSAGWDETSLIPISIPDSHPYIVKNTSVA